MKTEFIMLSVFFVPFILLLIIYLPEDKRRYELCKKAGGVIIKQTCIKKDAIIDLKGK